MSTTIEGTGILQVNYDPEFRLEKILVILEDSKKHHTLETLPFIFFQKMEARAYKLILRKHNLHNGNGEKHSIVSAPKEAFEDIFKFHQIFNEFLGEREKRISDHFRHYA